MRRRDEAVDGGGRAEEQDCDGALHHDRWMVRSRQRDDVVVVVVVGMEEEESACCVVSEAS
jgi:hypothetical protein